MLLVDDDHPSPRSGAKTAERAPDDDPRLARLAIRARSSRRSASVSPECRIATRSPKRARTRPTDCGASAISGTSRIVPRPRSSAAARDLEVDLGLARAGGAVEQEVAARPASSAATIRSTRRTCCSGRSAAGSGFASERVPLARWLLDLASAFRRRRRDERERPCRSRAVVVGEPEREVDERRRDLRRRRLSIGAPSIPSGGRSSSPATIAARATPRRTASRRSRPSPTSSPTS